MNSFFAYPAVRENRFLKNETAIQNDRFGSSLVEHNLFRSNQTAIHNNRKSQATIKKNIFEDNDLVLYSNYSSYPIVRNNNFLRNKVAAYLDVHMSANFEEREGSKTIVREEARALGTKNPMLEQAPEDFEDFVDLSGNWWGEDTKLLRGVGKAGNLDLFFDRRDMSEVEYEGYEGKRYALDRVVFSPWLEAEVPDAGPRDGLK